MAYLERILIDHLTMEKRERKRSWLLRSLKPLPSSSYGEDYNGLMPLIALARLVISKERPRKERRWGAPSCPWKKPHVRGGGGGGGSPWWSFELLGGGGTRQGDLFKLREGGHVHTNGGCSCKERMRVGRVEKRDIHSQRHSQNTGR